MARMGGNNKINLAVAVEPAGRVRVLRAPSPTPRPTTPPMVMGGSAGYDPDALIGLVVAR